MNEERINSHCIERVQHYQSLQIHGKNVPTPYYINQVEPLFINLMKDSGIDDSQIANVRKLYREKQIPYGWYRGKGTPEQIAEAAVAISEQVGLPLSKSDPDTIVEFMKLYALGVDCSGFVYNVLSYAFEKEGKFNLFTQSLDWSDKNKQSAGGAGAFVFAGNASDVIDPSLMREQDLILIKGRKSQYVHIGIMLRKDDGNLVVAQSSAGRAPYGVREDTIKPTQEGFKVDYQPAIGDQWETLYQNDRLEFRRLKVLSNE